MIARVCVAGADGRLRADLAAGLKVRIGCVVCGACIAPDDPAWRCPRGGREPGPQLSGRAR